MDSFYAIEKIHELETELRAGQKHLIEAERRPRKPVFGPIAARAGRALRRAGEGLESWANVPAPDERRMARRTR
jgi:hypothetical protein